MENNESEFKKENGCDWTFLYSHEGYERNEVTKWPYTIIFDRNGKVVFRHQGDIPYDTAVSELEKYI